MKTLPYLILALTLSLPARAATVTSHIYFYDTKWGPFTPPIMIGWQTSVDPAPLRFTDVIYLAGGKTRVQTNQSLGNLKATY